MLLLSYKINKAVGILPRQATATNQKKKGSYIIAQVERNEKNKQQRSQSSG
jgi:hypothetical protein